MKHDSAAKPLPNEPNGVQALASRFGFRWVTLDSEFEANPAALELVPASFAQEHQVFPVAWEAGTLRVAVSNPFDWQLLGDLKALTGVTVEVVVATPEAIRQAIDRFYVGKMLAEATVPEIELVRTDDEHELGDLQRLATETQTVQVVNLLLRQALQERASDIHVEPFEREVRVRFRIDGLLQEASTIPKRLQAAVASRIKIMAELNIAERRLPQDGRIRLKIAGRDVDVRVSTVPTVHGESLVLRLLDQSAVPLGLPELGMTPETLERWSQVIDRPHGILLVTGPTGSGKTTTLYAALRRIAAAWRKVITIEDPVEYELPGVNQIPVRPRIGLTFASGLRSILRQDPDVILVGEIRDVETAQIAIQAALTGHLVLSTLHTNDAASGITRLIDMGVDPYLIASTVEGILAQRLVRRVCRQCAGTGCAQCRGTGYFGRLGLFELLPVTDDMRPLVLARAPSRQIKEKARSQGMQTLREDGLKKAEAGLTTLEEVLRVTQGDEG